MIDYPLKFEPILQEKIWGGQKLKTLLNKNSRSKNTGESWEISGVPGNISKVSNGPLRGTTLTELISSYKVDLVGQKIYERFGKEFPLLIKFIDAKTDLSVQLHPNDELAEQRHNSYGKTEMWYIIQADKGSKLNIGFKRDLDKQEYLEFLERGKITEILNFEEVKKGDSLFINTGKVHAIGGGVLLAEIQQTSDITYRIFDWDRKDENGNSRELHTELALDAIDFKKKNDYHLPYEKLLNRSSNIASCRYFVTNYMKITGNLCKDYSLTDSFVIFICVQGKAVIKISQNEEILLFGESILIPAYIKEVFIASEDCELLEVTVP